MPLNRASSKSRIFSTAEFYLVRQDPVIGLIAKFGFTFYDGLCI